MSTADVHPGEWARNELKTLDSVIAYMETTAEEAWRVDTVRSADGTTNCFFGHLFNMGGTDERGSALWNTFEDLWATTYMLYPVNDGQHPDYRQPTPRQRVLAYLRALADGTAMTTHQSMEAEYEAHLRDRETAGA